MHEKEMKITRR